MNDQAPYDALRDLALKMLPMTALDALGAYENFVAAPHDGKASKDYMEQSKAAKSAITHILALLQLISALAAQGDDRSDKAFKLAIEKGKAETVAYEQDTAHDNDNEDFR